jgi:hypothetical protein
MKIKIASLLALVALVLVFSWLKQSPEEVILTSPKTQTSVPKKNTDEVAQIEKEQQQPHALSQSMEKLEDSDSLRAVLPEDNEEHLQLAQDLEQLEKVFDDVEERWSNQMRTLLITEFGLSEEDYKTYQQLREEYDMAKLQAYENYHQQLEETHGADAVYRLTLAEEEFQAPLQTEYEAKMHKFFGDDLFQRYLGIRDQFNNDLRADAQTQMPLFFIDF